MTANSSWSGRTVTVARATLRRRLPLPCARCGLPVVAHPESGWQVDHVLPRWAGGTNEPSNLWPSHATCNMSEGGKRGSAVTNARRVAPRLDSERSRGIRGI